MVNIMVKATNIKGELVYTSIAPTVFEALSALFEDAGVTVHSTFEVGKMPLNELPEAIQAQVKETLKAFPRCTVTYENGGFTASACTCIKYRYPQDHFVCGTYTAEEVYTLEERRQNYREAFGDNPHF